MQKLIVITGPTASGKTKYSIEYALKNNGEIINADSQQVYIETPILSAQPNEAEQKGIKHYLFGYKKLDEKYSVGHWLNDVMHKINEVIAAGKLPILVGGSVMYIGSLLDGISDIPEIDGEFILRAKQELEELEFVGLYSKLKQVDPIYAAVISPNDNQRLIRAWSVYLAINKPLSYFHALPKKKFLTGFEVDRCLMMKDREEIYNNVNTRFIQMLEGGAIDEAKRVMELGYDEIYTNKAHGLIQIIKYLKGDYTKKQAITESQQIIRNYAKRQMTWFRNRMRDFMVI